VFYLYVSLEFLGQVKVDGEVREDAQKLQDVMVIVIWFLAISSIVRNFIS
jgi:sodium/hydrogen antiporter